MVFGDKKINEEKKEELIRKKAAELVRLAADTVIINMRFMDVAISRFNCKDKLNLHNVATDGENFFYDSGYVLNCYLSDENSVTRMFLHSLLHCIFRHYYVGERKDIDEEYWDLACDIAVENIIMELDVRDFTLDDDSDRMQLMRGILKEVNPLTAEKLYRYFLVNPLSKADKLKFEKLFCRDAHFYWRKPETYELSFQAWKKISERIKTDLGTFSRASSKSESLLKNLVDTTAKKYDYKRILERFVVMGEELKVNDEEFDYIYYTYGLDHYGNMPLIEPLEFKDEKKVRDMAIVIDTSASCMGATVRAFLKKTYDILKGSESFATKVNVHIIQCDSEVRSDIKIENESDFDKYIAHGKLTGYGGTDFRPAFEYVDALIDDKEFENFKGLIYFTDGYGIYPAKAPDYDCMFVFVKKDDLKPEVPWWGIRVELQEDYILEDEEEVHETEGGS
ncbi:MAG: VWA-like domain-containing protein [Lachnospiraceae bacterium]|nr:VWA-like domain-containing protein [Lachnospiraceae bacterium]